MGSSWAAWSPCSLVAGGGRRPLTCACRKLSSYLQSLISASHGDEPAEQINDKLAAMKSTSDKGWRLDL